MKILIVSDTHGEHENYLKVLEKEKPLDMIFHCGDVCGGEYVLEEAADCPVMMVAGNNDFFSGLDSELEFEVAGKKVLLTHGHQYYVSTDPGFIKKEAEARQIDLVCYGHTHYPEISKYSNILVINPGSLTYPRQHRRIPTYAIVHIDQNGEMKAELFELYD